MSILLTPWFWVGFSILVCVIAMAWSGNRSAPSPRGPVGPGGRRPPDTKHEHGEYVDDPYIR